MDPIEQAALEAVVTSARALTVALSCGGVSYSAVVDEAVCVAQTALSHLERVREPRVRAHDPVVHERARIARVLRKFAADLGSEPVHTQHLVTFAYLLEAAS